MESYLNNTIKDEELFLNPDVPIPVELLAHQSAEVKGIFTYYYGQCFVFYPHPTINYAHWIFFISKMPSKLYILEDGQELCLVVGECSNQLLSIPVKEEVLWTQLSAREVRLPIG